MPLQRTLPPTTRWRGWGIAKFSSFHFISTADISLHRSLAAYWLIQARDLQEAHTYHRTHFVRATGAVIIYLRETSPRPPDSYMKLFLSLAGSGILPRAATVAERGLGPELTSSQLIPGPGGWVVGRDFGVGRLESGKIQLVKLAKRWNCFH